jgi:glutamate decarboxylase
MSQQDKSKHIFTEDADPDYGTGELNQPLPNNQIPQQSMLPRHAYERIHDQLMLDGNARLNLATFVTTWMEPEAQQLMQETFDKNMIDKDEYPQTSNLEMRCVSMLANLWHAPASDQPATGCSTTGSSEACMLAGMAMKWHWRARREQQGKPTAKPNLVMGINVQVCWDKFCRYWDVEMRQVPMDPGRYVICPDKAMALCDENTIGVVGILGSTFTGEYEPISALNDAIDKLNKKTGWDIPIHVDAASGGFVAPFIQPDLAWDFRLKWVTSINASGHKYGLVYPGVGWIVWRDTASLPEDLVFRVNYLGGNMPTFALNFSRPGSQVVAQYYTLIRLGFEGYRQIQQACQDIAVHLSSQIGQLGPFELLSDGKDLPVFVWKLKDPSSMNFTLFDFSERLRLTGWLIPAYALPDHLTDTIVCRIVIRKGFTMDLAKLLLEDIQRALDYFHSWPGDHRRSRHQSFSH